MARSTRRSKPDQRGAETLGGLPAQLHAIRKVGFDQLVRENALQRQSCLLPLEGLEKNPILPREQQTGGEDRSLPSSAGVPAL